jgi:hypothetical protein
MSRRRLREAIDEMDAEDRVIRYLANLPQQLAAITGVKAAIEAAGIREVEKEDMLRRGDPRRVYLSSANERDWLNSSEAKYCQDPRWQSCPAAEVLEHLAHLPADAAAFIAYKAARWACDRFRP